MNIIDNLKKFHRTTYEAINQEYRPEEEYRTMLLYLLSKITEEELIVLSESAATPEKLNSEEYSVFFNILKQYVIDIGLTLPLTEEEAIYSIHSFYYTIITILLIKRKKCIVSEINNKSWTLSLPIKKEEVYV